MTVSLATEETLGNVGPWYDAEPTREALSPKKFPDLVQPMPKGYDQGSMWGPGDYSSFLPTSLPPPTPAGRHLPGHYSLSSPQPRQTSQPWRAKRSSEGPAAYS